MILFLKKNPQQLSLPELTFHVKDNGVKLVIPALVSENPTLQFQHIEENLHLNILILLIRFKFQSKKWVTEQRHVKYLPLKADDMDDNFIDKWIKVAKWFVALFV